MTIFDIVTRGAISPAQRRDMPPWVGCVAGALDENDHRAKLAAAGFESIGVEPTRVSKVNDARAFLADKGFHANVVSPDLDGKFMSAFIRATKP